MDIIDLIKDDHSQINDLIEKIVDTTEEDFDERERLFNEMKPLLEAHTCAEERTVYEKFEDDDDVGPLILESYEDHKTVSELLESLSEMEFMNAEWLPKFRLLQESLSQHVAEEETELLPYIGDILDDAEREELGDSMKALEDDLLEAETGYRSEDVTQGYLETNM